MIYGIYFAYSQMEVIGTYDENKPIYPEELARVGKYSDKYSQIEAYSNTMCAASQLFEAENEESFNLKIKEYQEKFKNEDWLKENIYPYI